MWRYFSEATQAGAAMGSPNACEVVVIRLDAVFAHESMMSPYVNEKNWPGILGSVPEVFRSYVPETAFCDRSGMPLITACLWREIGGDRWHVGELLLA
jgi:hypothetical protein